MGSLVILVFEASLPFNFVKLVAVTVVDLIAFTMPKSIHQTVNHVAAKIGLEFKLQQRFFIVKIRHCK